MNGKPMPRVGELREYEHAVAGHAGTLCSPAGDTFIKPCKQIEVDFYESAKKKPDFAKIIPFYYGKVNLLQSKTDVDTKYALPGVVSDDGIQPANDDVKAQVATQVAAAATEATTPNGGDWVPSNGKRIDTDMGVMLDNSTFGYTKPNILDVKLGTRLWADDAHQIKKERFEQISEETTHKNLGFRISGMHVYRGSKDKKRLNEKDYLVYDKDYGRFTMNDDNILEGFRSFVFNTEAGIDSNLGSEICKEFARRVAHIQDVLERHETRMFSSSLLFVFEGDGEALRSAIKINNQIGEEEEAKEANRTTLRTDSGIAMGDDDELTQAPVLGGGEATVIGFEGDDSGASDCTDSTVSAGPPPVLSVQLIDFAHAEWTPDEGPDENVLRGVRSVRKIFEQLAEESEQLSG